MHVFDYDYELPQALIAQTPAAQRSQSRLFVLERANGQISHDHFYDLPNHLQAGDLLVANDSRVIPARLYGVKESTGAVIELLLLRPHGKAGEWQALVRPGKRVKAGQTVVFGDGALKARVGDALEDGVRVVEFSLTDESFDALLDVLGEMPLPPYIKEKLHDNERYQTVYARAKGSVAAPTAGLHFTPQLLDQLKQQGVETEFITLHVGLGTFRPVQVENVGDHHMHEEWYAVSAKLFEKIQSTRAAGHRVVSVGTTTVRALESAYRKLHSATSGEAQTDVVSGLTDIFIYPGFEFHATDALITNFHLPKSTLLMLISALAGRERILDAYRVAVKEQYRFFSFGDAMLIK